MPRAGSIRRGGSRGGEGEDSGLDLALGIASASSIQIATLILPLVVLLSALLFVGITARMISASALISAVPEPARRGSFMSVNSSLQQFAGGLAAAAAGLVVVQKADGSLGRYDVLGYVVVVAMLLSVGMLYIINRQVARQLSR